MNIINWQANNYQTAIISTLFWVVFGDFVWSKRITTSIPSKVCYEYVISGAQEIDNMFVVYFGSVFQQPEIPSSDMYNGILHFPLSQMSKLRWVLKS